MLAIVLRRWDVSDWTQQPTVIEPVNPLEGCILDRVDVFPRPSMSDHLRLEQPDDRLSVCVEFIYALAVAHVRGDKAVWENHARFIGALGGNPIRVITFQDMVEEIYDQLGTTLAATEVGRMLQTFRAAKIDVSAK